MKEKHKGIIIGVTLMSTVALLFAILNLVFMNHDTQPSSSPSATCLSLYQGK